MEKHNTILLDSSVWIWAFLEDDSNHEISLFIVKNITGLVYVPYCVICEVCTVLTYKHSRDLANQFLDFIDWNNEVIQIDNARKEEILFYKTIPDKVSFTDVSIIYTALIHDVQLITLDKQMLRIYEKLLMKKWADSSRY